MLAPLLLSVLLTATAASPRDSSRIANPNCKSVSGEIVAAATRIAPALNGVKIYAAGRSAGSLNGHVAIEVLKPFVGNALKTRFSVTSGDGSVSVFGITVLARTDSIDGVRTMRFESAGRDWVGAGVVNHRSREMRFAFTGRQCPR